MNQHLYSSPYYRHLLKSHQLPLLKFKISITSKKSIHQMGPQPQDSIQQMEPQLQESKKPNNKRSDSAAADAEGSKVQTLQVKEKLWSSLKSVNLGIYQAHTAIFFWIGCLLCAINCLTLLLGPWSLILMFSWSFVLAIHALVVRKNDGDNEHYDYQIDFRSIEFCVLSLFPMRKLWIVLRNHR